MVPQVSGWESSCFQCPKFRWSTCRSRGGFQVSYGQLVGGDMTREIISIRFFVVRRDSFVSGDHTKNINTNVHNSPTSRHEIIPDRLTCC